MDRLKCKTDSRRSEAGNLKKYKSSFFINLIGLSAGLSCAVLIYLWVNDEVRIDKFHAKGERLYQIMENEVTTEGVHTVDGTSAILSEALLKEMPEVEDAVTASPSAWLKESKVLPKGSTPIKAGGKFAGKNFFKVFSYPLLTGNPSTVLSGKTDVVVSEDLARKLYHSTEVIGKDFTWSNSEMDQVNHAQISGVFKNTPANSSDQFDFLVSLESFFQTAPQYLRWSNRGPNTFVILKKGASAAQFNAKLKGFMKGKGEHHRELFSRPFADGYLYSRYENGVQAGGRIAYVKLFSLIAIFILLIACINFMNLSTARASRRMKEVGVKKVLGAHRSDLVIQYLTESLFLAILSLFVALLCVELILPAFNRLTDKSLILHFDLKLSMALLGITLFTGLVSGSYPALYLSGFKPVFALKGRLRASFGEMLIRKGLVVFQFALSVMLIVAVLVIYKQVQFVQTQDQGYQKDNVISLPAEGKLAGNVGAFLAEVKRLPGVLNASGMNRNLLGDLQSTNGEFSWEGRDPKEPIKFQTAGINSGLIETLGMKMSAGRSFSEKFGSDSSKIIINESGIKVMRLKDPIGKKFILWGKELEIVGVLKDFHFESLHEAVKPMFMLFDAKHTNKVMIRLEGGKIKETIAALQNFYEHFNPGYNFDYHFLDQDFQAQYIAENRVSALSRYFAILAIVISCLGLFGLAAFTAERRVKEVGIRKVLGATEMNILYLLSKDFTRPVLIAIVIALPISYIASRDWLSTFAYRIDLPLWYFAAAGLLVLGVAWLTVSVQALKAAAAEPVKSLKSE
eukprot:gene3002-3450_t